MKRKLHRGYWMRLGFFSKQVIDKLKDKKVIWLHTVSVGEAQAAATLVKSLKQEYPDASLVISTVTKTGSRIAQKLSTPEDVVIYFPLDIGVVARRVINLINPQLFIIAETEIWPNVVISLAKKGVPIVLVNGRISSGSFKGYKIIRPFLKKILQSFSLFCMQTKTDAQRIVELGAEENKVKVTGNMKFDVDSSKFEVQTLKLELKEGEQLLIAGSTHRGEEKIILQVFKELIKSHPRLRLLIAPRHIERVQEVEKLVSRFGLAPQRVSQLNLTLPPTTYHLPPILILDTIGQLKSLYALADIVFIGGSLIAHGGQNPIEPALFFKPIIFGPDMSNFSHIAQLFINSAAAIMVKDIQGLKETCAELLHQPELRKELGEKAHRLIQENQGATLKNLELIKKLIIDIL